MTTPECLVIQRDDEGVPRKILWAQCDPRLMAFLIWRTWTLAHGR